VAERKGTRNKALALAKKAQKILEDKKGEDITLLDVKKSGVADYFLLVSGTSAPHLKAMADEVQYALKHEGLPSYRRAGDQESGWIVLDYVEVIIHIFSNQTRHYYSIEDLWAKAPRQSP
jgi:ribosome-associated protein